MTPEEELAIRRWLEAKRAAEAKAREPYAERLRELDGPEGSTLDGLTERVGLEDKVKQAMVPWHQANPDPHPSDPGGDEYDRQTRQWAARKNLAEHRAQMQKQQRIHDRELADAARLAIRSSPTPSMPEPSKPKRKSRPNPIREQVKAWVREKHKAGVTPRAMVFAYSGEAKRREGWPESYSKSTFDNWIRESNTDAS